jgi:hypothetical protein
LKSNFKNEKARYLKALALIKKKEIDHALVEANILIQIQPLNANYFFLRGVIFEKMDMV